MIRHKAKQGIQKIFYSNLLRRILKILIFIAIVLVYEMNIISSGDFEKIDVVLIFIGLVLLSLEAIETHVYKIDKEINENPEIHKGLKEARDNFADEISTDEPEEASIIALSGTAEPVRHLISRLLNNGCEVRLLLQHPDTLNIEGGPKNTVSTLRYLYEFHKNDNLHIHFYEGPATIFTIITESKVKLGFYTFDNRDPDHRPVWGHTNPCLLLSDDDIEKFAIFKYWLTTVFSKLWEEGTSLNEWEDSEPELLEKWLNQGSRDQKEKWCESTSEKYNGVATNMFGEYTRMKYIADMELS